MYIAVDDTDSRKGMCTTYVLSEIIRSSGLDLIGYPSLVRLNPSIEHKTRGNGALCANLGHGTGTAIKIGNFNGVDLLCYPQGESSCLGSELMDLASEIVNGMAELDENDTNPGIVASEFKFDSSFYWKAVRDEISIQQAEKFIMQQGGSFRKVKNGRGIIGSAAAISWPGTKVTYELLSYKYPSGSANDSESKLAAAIMANRIKGSFNNIDQRNSYAAIFPRERTPVVFGVRGTDPAALSSEVPKIIVETGLNIERSLLYVTNQATDDHIIMDPDQLKQGSSYSLEGTLKSQAYSIEGGHYFVSMEYGNLELNVAAFEPTKEFREVFSKLAPGDRIRVYGTFKDNCLNVEKMEVKAVSGIYKRMTPECSECGGMMYSKGHKDYRCRYCGHRDSMPFYRREQRQIQPGRYDVPVMARRHLSRPFELDFPTGRDMSVEVPA